MTQPVGKLAGVCSTPEELLVYIARVSNPTNQANLDTYPKLLRYCIEHKHWSVFETVNITVEIETSRAIATQILRHRSFTFQEFSQRYATVTKLHQALTLRMKGDTNRQGSLEDAPDHAQRIADKAILQAEAAYAELLNEGVAPESARFVLPLSTTTTLYMTGNVRSWIFYLEQRTSSHAQKEHRELAELIQQQLVTHFPVLAEALNWRGESN